MFFGRCCKQSLYALLLCGAGASEATADVLTLQWDPSPDSAVAGYTVYVGTEPGTYATTVNVGNRLRFDLQDAEPGRSYYFAVAAYTSANIIGPLSAEISGRIDGVADTVQSDMPTVIVTMPAQSSSFTTSTSSVLLGGVAVDDQGITAVEWTNDRGGSGQATGTDQWMAAVPLRKGRNEITITAVDGNSNRSSIRISVYRTSI